MLTRLQNNLVNDVYAYACNLLQSSSLCFDDYHGDMCIYLCQEALNCGSLDALKAKVEKWIDKTVSSQEPQTIPIGLFVEKQPSNEEKLVNVELGIDCLIMLNSTPWKSFRDILLVKDFINGYSTKWLSERYSISQERCYQILRYYKYKIPREQRSILEYL